MKMRGIYSSVTDIRRKVFTEVARLAYEEGDYAEKIAELPYKIVPGSKAVYRESIFLERAIVEERLRLAIGLPLRPIEEHKSVADGIEESAIAEKYYDPPLVNIIKFACNGCPETHYHVTDCCQGCLAHPCQEVCPKGAITIKHGKSVIDQSKCIKCGRCQSVCPYNAINKMERPCARACGMDAIGSDEEGKAKIDYDKCVSCGMCLVNCPFGAIVDKGQIFQLITAMKKKKKVIAIVAPAFVGQFGPKASPEKLTAAMKKLGFADVVEVAIGADLCSIEEAKDFMREVPEHQPFMATSCCPAWSV
ncbi:[Fe-Fe] hydrogenase large subunit C-terminal domain-containing protein, partial [Ruminococcus bicirculans (ex Wegman et al. 2014)]